MLKEKTNKINEHVDFFYETRLSRSLIKNITLNLDFLLDTQCRIQTLNDIEQDSSPCCHFNLMELDQQISYSERTIDSIQDIARHLIFLTENVRINNKQILNDFSDVSECLDCRV